MLDVSTHVLFRSALALVAVSALSVVPATAAAAMRDDAPAGAPVTPEALAALLADGTPSAKLSEAQRSPDGTHILFRKGSESAGNLYPGTFWVVRSDGSQLARLGSNEYLYAPFLETAPKWASNSTVTWTYTGNPSRFNTYRWSTVSTLGGVETWAAPAVEEQGFLTPDGRFLVDEQYPGVGANDWATVVATGVRHLVRTELPPTGPGSKPYAWNDACKLPSGESPGNRYSVAQALAGDDPICDFGATTTPTPTPTPTATPTPTPAPTATPTPTATPLPQKAPIVTSTGGFAYGWLGGISIVTGAHFVDVTSIRFGDKKASTGFALGTGTLVVVAPPQAAGTYPVVVETKHGVSSGSVSFTYKRLF